VVFHPLDRDQVTEIVGIQFDILRARLAEQDIAIVIQPAALEALVEEGYDPVYGARPLKRAIQKRIENPLASKLLGGEYPPGATIEVGYSGGEYSFGR
jgi:ATP-dependent Clp protease ATP-binding subunit ClpB